MDVKLDRATWGNIGGSVWKRDLDGIEWYENMAAAIWPNEHTFVGRGTCGHDCEALTLAGASMMPCLLLRTEELLSREKVVDRLRRAWAVCLCEISQVTTDIRCDEDGQPRAFYEDSVDAASLRDAVDYSLTCQDIEHESEDLWTHIDQCRCELSQAGLPKRGSTRVLIRALLFGCASTIKNFALVVRADHAVMDGTGILLCMDMLLRSFASGCSPSNGESFAKAAPQPALSSLLTGQLLEQDHSSALSALIRGYGESGVSWFPQQMQHMRR